VPDQEKAGTIFAYVLDFLGAQGRNRTTDTVIFSQGASEGRRCAIRRRAALCAPIAAGASLRLLRAVVTPFGCRAPKGRGSSHGRVSFDFC
jgi:hypothetical protein